MALEPEQAGNLADHDVIGLDSKTGAQFGIVLRSQKWVEREAAEDRGVLLRLSDTGCQILSLHGFGHDDEVSGDFGGAPRSEEHTSELQSPYVISYAVF